MISDLTLASLNKALNFYLDLDPDSTIRRQELSGKVLALAWRDTEFKLYLLFTPDEVVLMTDPPLIVHTEVLGSAWGLMQLGLQPFPQKGLLPESVEISGDVELGQTVQALFSEMEIDWEEYLSRCVGDVIAHHVGDGMRAFWQWGTYTKSSIEQHVTEYLQEETRLMPPSEEIADFCNDVDELRDDVERLIAEFEWMQTQHRKTSE